MSRIAYRCMCALLVIALTVVAGGCGGEETYSAEEIVGWVVDADTGRPIENVNVVAGWQLEGGLEGNSTKGWFKVIEATTDANGKYVIPAWGPETKRVEGTLKDGAPLLIFFKPGYEFHQAANAGLLAQAKANTASLWNGKQIKLRRQRSSEYPDVLTGTLDDVINELLKTTECNWKFMPNFLFAVEAQNHMWQSKNLKWHTRSLNYLDETYSGKCGSLKAYVLERSK